MRLRDMRLLTANWPPYSQSGRFPGFHLTANLTVNLTDVRTVIVLLKNTGVMTYTNVMSNISKSTSYSTTFVILDFQEDVFRKLPKTHRSHSPENRFSELF